jgi:hypothetical protein
MQIHLSGWVLVAALTACASSQRPVTDASSTAAPERTALTQEACQAQAGTVVGDIGDGATRRSDYVCPNGKSPLGDLTAPPGGPIPVEGAVCCPR